MAKAKKIEVTCNCGKTFKVDSHKTRQERRSYGSVLKITTIATCPKCGDEAKNVTAMRMGNIASY